MTRADREQRGKAVRERPAQRLSVVLPLPPSSNHLYNVVRGRWMLSKDGKAYLERTAWEIHEAAIVTDWETTSEQRYRFELVLFFPDQRRTDLDNRVKAVSDAAAAALGYDDSRIDELIVRRGSADRDNPRAELTIAVI